jgi:hypothetical protein
VTRRGDTPLIIFCLVAWLACLFFMFYVVFHYPALAWGIGSAGHVTTRV